MSKTPPLVIPVVIDGTGVNRGLNNVNSRLRKGVSGGASGAGFGSGGGDALAVAAAAGIGAGIGAGGASASRMNAASQPSSAFRARMDAQSRRFNRNRFRGFTSYGSAGQDYFFRMGEEAYDAYDPISERGEAFRDAHRRVSRAANERERYRASATRRSFARGMNRGLSSVSNMFGRIPLDPTKLTSLGLSRGALIGGGIGGAVTLGAMGAARFATNAARTADSESVIGNRNYGTMRGIQITEALRRPNLSFGQGVLAGARNVTGGPSSIETFGSLLRQGYESSGLGIGTAIETFFNAFGGGSQVQQAWRHAYFKMLGN
jgi:hypothetical protein